MRKRTAMDGDLLVGWTKAFVGSHWSRGLPDGRIVHLSTWRRVGQGGYILTVSGERTEHPDLGAALAAYEAMAAAARTTKAAAAP